MTGILLVEMSWWQKMFGSRAAAEPVMGRDPEPLRFRVEETAALRGSPAGTRAWLGSLGNGGQEARFRMELSPEASQVSEEFGFSGGGFWREPAPASFIPALCAAFGAASPEVSMKVSKIPVVIERFTAEGSWFTAALRLQESKALVQLRFSLVEAAGEIRLLEAAKAQAVVDELAQVL
jgi:hypothetical protein